MTINVETADYYRTLQVDPIAEFAVIRAAHRALAAEHHPDVGGLESDMAALNVAWSVLSDPKKRSAYDHDRRLRQDGARYCPDASVPAAHHVGSIIDYGRYAGWSIPEIAQSDSDYLEWLVRTPNGRRYRNEIIDVLGGPSCSTATLEPPPRTGRFRRR
ncbi:MAG TPA: J domain-containing protein [Candidatus Limnocylindrales bacterium]